MYQSPTRCLISLVNKKQHVIKGNFLVEEKGMSGNTMDGEHSPPFPKFLANEECSPLPLPLLAQKVLLKMERASYMKSF